MARVTRRTLGLGRLRLNDAERQQVALLLRERRMAFAGFQRDAHVEFVAALGQPPAQLDLTGALNVKQNGREVEILANGNSEQLLEKLKSHSPEELRCESLSLEEIFVVSDILKKAKAGKP